MARSFVRFVRLSSVGSTDERIEQKPNEIGIILYNNIFHPFHPAYPFAAVFYPNFWGLYITPRKKPTKLFSGSFRDLPARHSKPVTVRRPTASQPCHSDPCGLGDTWVASKRLAPHRATLWLGWHPSILGVFTKIDAPSI